LVQSNGKGSTMENGFRRLCRGAWLGAAILGVAAVSGTGSARAYTGEALAKNAKVTIAEARRLALEARPGAIADEELERERGGTGLRHSFDVRSGAKTYEVGIDARTGKVLENRGEGANPD
jgi:uncharacterized membrane protein YkoI